MLNGGTVEAHGCCNIIWEFTQ